MPLNPAEYEQFAEVLRDNGGTMEFDQYMTACRAAKLHAAHWLRAKHAGVIDTELREGAVLVILPDAE